MAGRDPVSHFRCIPLKMLNFIVAPLAKRFEFVEYLNKFEKLIIRFFLLQLRLCETLVSGGDEGLKPLGRVKVK